jgi:hypothetical protein
VQRWSWNLLLPAPDQPVLRSIPPDNPYIWDAGRWQNRERPVTHWGLGRSVGSPRGAWQVRRPYDIQRPQYSQPFEIWRDVLVPSTDAELVASTSYQRSLVGSINEVVDKINRIEIMRMQVEDLRKANAANKPVDAALEALNKRMYDTELNFLSRTGDAQRRQVVRGEVQALHESGLDAGRGWRERR